MSPIATGAKDDVLVFIAIMVLLALLHLVMASTHPYTASLPPQAPW